MPEPSIRVRLAVGLLVAIGAAACGPSGGNPANYTIVFALSDSPQDLATLSFHVAYQGGSFVGNGSGVSCTLVNTANNETADFSDDDNGTLSVAIDATDNALTPASEIVTCQFSATTQPTAANFTNTVISAVDDLGDPVAPADVDIVVTSTDLSQAASSGIGEVRE